MDQVIKATLEQLGDWKTEEVLADDLAGLYPRQLDQLDVHRWVVPQEFGGDLTSIEELFWRGRTLASKNVTAAIALGQCFLGSLPIWIAGTPEQKSLVAKRLLAKGNSCLALTEKEHGSDLSATAVRFHGGKLNGEKWCINNATIGTTMSVLVNSDEGLSVLLLDKEQLDPNQFRYSKKLKTHGIRGADISGIIFQDCDVDSSMVVGKPGKGLDIIAKTLQVSRTLCGAFSLGALDACEEMVSNFTKHRILYGKPLDQIESVRVLLEKYQRRYAAIEALTVIMCRACTLYPQAMSLYSAVTKFLTPTVAQEGLSILGEVLGARSYLNEEEYPLFEKFKRDHSVVPLFDGSSAVNLSLVISQFGNILRHLELKADYSSLYECDQKVPGFTGAGMKLTNRGFDFVFAHYNFHHQDPILDQAIAEFKRELIKGPDKNSYAARQLAIRYCQLIAACNYVNFAKVKRYDVEDIVSEILKTNYL